MNSALIYLLVKSWQNRNWMRVRRLKQPKYLIFAIIGAGYFYSYFIGFLFNPKRFAGGMGVGPFGASASDPVLWQSIGALILLVIFLGMWIFPTERAALVLSEAEVAFLFPAPIDRKTLVRFKLLKAQVAIVTSVIFLQFIGVLTGRTRSLEAGLIHGIGWWLIFSILSLHKLGASFARTMLLDHGISNWKRRGMVLTLAGLGVAGVAVWVMKEIPRPDFSELTGMEDLKYYGEQILESGPLPYLLFPFRLIVKPYLAPDLVSFLVALAPAALLVVVHYVWVMRSDVAFEEASVEASQKMAERIANIRASRSNGGAMIKPRKKKRAPFELKPSGLPSVALLWKNLIHAGHSFTPRFWLRLLVVGVILCMYLRGTGFGSEVMPVIAILIPMLMAWSLLIGPQLFRQDFRSDMAMADVLKTYPLKSWQLALGELLAPTVILTFVHWFLIVMGVLMFYKFDGRAIPLGMRISAGLALAVIMPGLNLICLMIPNCAVLLFPGWFQAGKDAPQGIEATGQRLVLALGQFFVFAVTILPPAIVFGLVMLVGGLMGNPVLILPVAAIPAAILIAAECWGGLLLLGRLFERYDLSGETGA
ncbi:ABC transporter permease [Pedosphaera parvula]|uniref:Putative ABC transporter, permease protein n=1 Tax=Pedosphaera parvula (strain Ellin514) TaxID=320771 RepID=B9XBL2_PEDPL|nr:ABC transporter permease [Pedosphaera parvula]EEF62897.1 putative ABC transporter, permease protein [Pedosphaera parvula Ellin514]